MSDMFFKMDMRISYCRAFFTLIQTSLKVTTLILLLKEAFWPKEWGSEWNEHKNEKAKKKKKIFCLIQILKDERWE